MTSTLNQTHPAQPAIRRGRYRVPDDQRKRVRTACENCRGNKLRCDGALPCTRCAEMEKRCRYTPKPSLQRRHTTRDETDNESVVHGIEEDETQMMREILAIQHPEAAKSLAGLRALRQALALGRQDSQRTETILLQNNASTEPPAHSSPRRYVPCDHAEEQDQQADAHVGNSAASITILDQGKTRFEGNSSLWAFFDAARRHGTSGVEAQRGSDEHDEADCSGTTIHPMSLHGFGTDLKTVILTALPPKGVVEFLSSTFFRLAQSNYFCIHPEIYYRKLKAFYDRGEEFDSRDSPGSQRTIEFISLLFMVLAIGAQFADVGTDINQADDEIDWTLYERSPHLLPQVTIPVSKQNPGWNFCEISRKLLPDVVCSSSMASIQICVLQGIFLPSTGSRDAGYNLLGLALRMAVNMGLHRSIRCNQLHPQVRELRNRLWWTVYVAERMYSIEMGRPLAISDSEVDASYPFDTIDYSQSNQPTPGVGGLIAMIDICKILGKIVQAVYCDAATVDGTVMRPMVVRQLKSDLDRWKSKLPLALRVNTLPFRRSVAHLALVYEQAMILLTRPCLLVAILPLRSTVPSKEDAHRFLQQQAHDCVAAALSSIKLLSKLKAESLLSPFSFHDGPYCSSALHVLHLASQIPDVAPVVSGKYIFQGLSVLKVLAKGSKLAAVNLRHIVHAIAAAAAKEPEVQAASKISGFEQAGQHSDDRGRDEWHAWVAQSAASMSTSVVPTVLTQDNSETPNSETPNSVMLGLTDASTLPVQTNWLSTGIHQNNFASWVQGSQIQAGLEPSLDYGKNWGTSDMWNLTPFIISGTTEFDILERDWGNLPDIH